MRAHPIRTLRLAALALAAAPASAQEGGIEVFAGETLFERGWRVSLTEIYKPGRKLFAGTSRAADPLDREQWEARTVLGVDHGVHRDVTLSLLVPVVHRELRTSGQRLTATGLGDAVLIGKYRLVKEEWRAGTFNLALVGGVETPTGRTDVRDGGARLAPSLQPGRGAWSPFVALSATAGQDRFRFDATLFYKHNPEGSQSFDPGDFASVEAAIGYRFLHYRYPGPTFGARLGVQWRHEGRGEQGGLSLANSGADEIFLKPGLSIHPIPAMDLSLQVRIPVYRDYHGAQLGRDLEYSIAFGLRF